MDELFEMIGDVLGNVFGNSAPSADIEPDNVFNIHGNPDDLNGHGVRPLDGQGNESGRDILGRGNNKTIYD